MVQHTTLQAVDVGIGLAAIPLLITAVLLLARLAGRMSRLARTGAAICVVGFCGLAAVHGFEYAELAMLDAGVSPATVEIAVGMVQPAIAIPFMVSSLGALSVGLPLPSTRHQQSEPFRPSQEPR
jgi:TRAP-type C4-dicarboxylate transport system permease small subunit